MNELIPIAILLIGIAGYFIRLEVKLAEIRNDLKWIKERLLECQLL